MAIDDPKARTYPEVEPLERRILYTLLSPNDGTVIPLRLAKGFSLLAAHLNASGALSDAAIEAILLEIVE
jgi:hypothetical protein